MQYELRSSLADPIRHYRHMNERQRALFSSQRALFSSQRALIFVIAGLTRNLTRSRIDIYERTRNEKTHRRYP